MRPRWPRTASLVAAVLLTAALGACGGADPEPKVPASAAAPSAGDFPAPKRGETLTEMRAALGSESLVLAPSVSVLEAGERNRFAFGLFDASQRQISEASAAVYFAQPGGGEVEGPYPARYESLAVSPQFRSEGTTSDPHAAQTLYVADVPFDRPGRYEMLGLVRLGDRTVAATPAQGPVQVVRDSPVPDVGEPAPRVSTPTVASVSGAIEDIDTRAPPAPELHDADLAEVAGERPVALLFATPALCSSRVCGPVVDIMLEQRAASEGEDAEYIHMEIYEDNVVEEGFRPQVRAYDLPTEPWLFTIDREGRVATRIEGAFSASELERAVDAAGG